MASPPTTPKLIGDSMKIAFFTDTYEPQINGVVTSIKLYAEQLRKLGHEVHIFCPYDKRLEKNRFVHATKSFKFKPYPEFRATLPTLNTYSSIKKIKPDIIHVHTPATIGFAGMTIAKYLKIPLLMTYHTLIDEYINYLVPKSSVRLTLRGVRKFSRKYTKFFYNRADLIFVPSTPISQLLKRYGIKKRIEVLPTGIELKKHRVSKKASEIPTVLHVGRLCKEKQVDAILRAFKEVLKQIDARLIITSDGPERRNLDVMAKELGIDRNITFTGYVTPKKLAEIYKTADVFVSASRTETQGIVVLEAFAMGCPAVVPDELGFKDFVVDGKNGLFFRKNSEIADKIHKILKDKKLRNRLAENAVKTSKQFEIEKCAKALESFYKNILSCPRVSIIVPTYMEEKYIGKTLRSVRKQTYKNYELIVIDSASSDKTVKIAKKYADKVILTKKRGIALGRNMGAKAASGIILLFIDADTFLEKNFVERIVNKFRSKDVVGVCGYIKSYGSLANKITYWLCSEIAWLSTLLNIPLFYGMCMAWRKNAFERIGGFDEHLTTGEDIIITRKMARHGKCVLLRNAIAVTSPRRVVGMGLLNAVAFHIKNFFRIIFFKKPADYYSIMR